MYFPCFFAAPLVLGMVLGSRESKVRLGCVPCDSFQYTLNLNQWESLKFSKNSLSLRDTHWFEFIVRHSTRLSIDKRTDNGKFLLNSECITLDAQLKNVPNLQSKSYHSNNLTADISGD